LPDQGEQNIALFTLPPMKGLNPLFKSYDLFFHLLGVGDYPNFTSTLEADFERE